ncbi:BREX system P-loop protein BrxC [Runella sp. SP2]|uniref:BREX system P-loop protein BrxC n=1 Tax=Runella sp. SP2 TaxID=2268026 RepID=UPI000F0760A2|nr:BREX system P-loop protein BrxC [Runella sp. SP2]AYQ36585.1 BREX system P-loop protein BrxC [Runella sp. SP2]
MKNKELFSLNPDDNNLMNDGVVEINTAKDDKGQKIIRHELKTFVCEGEYQKGIYRILDTYLKHIEQPKQPAVWVSGFFGSGKSHLVKMLGYFWEDFKLDNGDTARTIKPLPDDVNDLLIELERKQKINGRLSVSGTLKDFPSPDIRYSFLQLLLNALGLPQQYHLFKFIYWTKQEGIHDGLKSLIEAQGKDFKKEYENLFVSTPIAKAILELKPEFAENEAKVKENFKVNFKRFDSINREQLIDTIKSEILPMFFGDKIPLTIVVLDEVQQFIGQDGDKSIDLQNLAQDICSSFDGKFLLIGTGQNALSETSLLQRLQDRFTVKVSLSDTDVETVTRKTVLEKKPSVINEIDKKLDAALGEISRNLSGTDFGYVTADRATLVADYPILPSTRKFWKKILQAIDTAGTAGQLRSQLRIVDESIKKVADKELGYIVPADLIFEQKQSQLLQNALLLNETNNLIESLKAKGGDSALEGRILSAVFMIDQLPKDTSGKRFKSDENSIAELLFDNLNESSDKFRTKVKELIKKLVEEKVLMPVDDEYKLQTKVGSEWEQTYKAQEAKITNSGEDQIQQLRKERIIAYFKEKTKTVNILQGVSKQKRDFDIWDKETRPATDNKLNIWVRDGWFENDSTVLDEIRAEGADAPLAYAFVKKLRDPELRSEIIKYLAAGLTLNTKGLPSSLEGEQAKKSMETRRALAKAAIDELIDRICKESIVYLAGGNKVENGSIRDNIEEALNNIADRQFTDFKNKGDFKDWDKALTKGLSNDPDALKRIGWDKEAKDHPVAVEILRFIGNNTKQGKEIRSHFTKAPYGWSQDAIDTIIVMLKNTEHISTPEPNLNQSKIAGAVFKKEVHTLSASEKIKLRRLYQEAGISCKSGEEFLHSNSFLKKLKDLAENISGDAPKPEPIDIRFLKNIENLDGNERLVRIVEEQADLKEKYLAWAQQADIVRQREPNWLLLSKLSSYANDADTEKLKAEIDAIREDRLLLQEPDLIEPKLRELTEKLKTALNGSKKAYTELYDLKMSELKSNDYFKQLSDTQQNAILNNHQLLAKPEIKALDAQGLLNHLQRESLNNWKTKIAALPGQFQSALEEAIQLAAPKAVTYSLPRKTINTTAEIEEYLTDLKEKLEELLTNSGSIILK